MSQEPQQGLFERDWNWPLLRQLRRADPLGSAARSPRSETLQPHLRGADRVGTSICPPRN